MLGGDGPPAVRCLPFFFPTENLHDSIDLGLPRPQRRGGPQRYEEVVVKLTYMLHTDVIFGIGALADAVSRMELRIATFQEQQCNVTAQLHCLSFNWEPASNASVAKMNHW